MNTKNIKSIPFWLLICQIILGILSVYFAFFSDNKEIRLFIVSSFFLMSGFLSFKYLKSYFQALIDVLLFIIYIILYFTN